MNAQVVQITNKDITKQCPICGKIFKSKNETKKYCNQGCSYEAEKIRAKVKRDKAKFTEVIEAKTEAHNLVPVAEINVIGHQTFIGREIPIIEGGFGEGKRCLTDKAIAEIHNTEVKVIRQLIKNNINRFKDSIDYIDLKQVINNDLFSNLDFTKAQVGNSKHIYLLSERGYAKLIKIMDTDLAWEIHDELIDRYFSMRQSIQENKKQLPGSYKEALQQLLEQVEANEKLETEIKIKDQVIGELKPKADYTDIILQNKGLVTITQIAKDYGMSGQELNLLLFKLKVQYKQSNQWLLYSKYQGCGYTHSETIPITRSNGLKDIRMNTKWTQKGRLFLYELLRENGSLPVIEQEV